MLLKEDLYRLVCRPALPKDTADVMQLASLIWDGDDYVPGAWSDWLEDDEGVLVVAEYGGRVIGLGKLTHLGSDDWWLEGLRVHPDYEGRGVASSIHDYQQAYWAKYGFGIVRLATSSKREAVKHLCQRSGFRQVVQLASYQAPAGAGQSDSFRQVKENELAGALATLQGSATHRLAQGLVDISWQWAPPSAEYLAGVIDQGRAWWWGREGEVQGLVVVRRTERREESRMRVEALACELDALADILDDLPSFAGKWAVEQVRWLAPLHPGLSGILEDSGYQRDRDHTLFIYEKEHPRSGI